MPGCVQLVTRRRQPATERSDTYRRGYWMVVLAGCPDFRLARSSRAPVRRRLLTALFALVAMAGVLPSHASAFDAQQSLIVTANPANNTPDVNVGSSGSVRYLAQTGNTMVAGGNFTKVRNPGGGTTYTRNNIFSFDVNTGAVNPSFAPNV